MKRITISVNDKLYSYLCEVAELNCVSVSILIRLIIIDFYKNDDGKGVING